MRSLRASLLALSAGFLLAGCEQAEQDPFADLVTAEDVLGREQAGAVAAPPSPPGRPAVVPSAETYEAARQALAIGGGEAADSTCGPYQVLSTAGAQSLAICSRLAEQLDLLYSERLGVELGAAPKGLIVLFGSSEGFRAFATELGRLRVGYAGFTLASRGLVAVNVEGTSPKAFASTLGHELAHLVHRRVFGPNLPPWLSEGLADALGDTAGQEGFDDLRGLEGVEPLAERLVLARRGRKTRNSEAPSPAAGVASVIARTRSDFDRGTVSYDYESSALLVRFLLLDPALGPEFRAFLARLAAGASCSGPCVLDALGVSEAELESAFDRWLEAALG